TAAALMALLLTVPLSAHAAATVDIQADVRTGTISPGLFGASILHPAYYNGVDPLITTQAQYDTEIARWYGYAEHVHALRPTVLRYPGGIPFSERFNWKKAIGPFAERKLLTDNRFLGTIEILPNQVTERTRFRHDKKIIVGLDEFLRLAEDMGADAMITTPVDCQQPDPDPAFSYGCPRDLAELVEYVNTPDDGSNPDPDGLAADDPSNIDWARIRADNGHPEPYNVRYFEIGVETRAPYNFLLPGLEFSNDYLDYGEKFADRYLAMKAIDPTIKIGAVGWDAVLNPGQFSDWTVNVRSQIEARGAAIDFWQFHKYLPGGGDLLRGMEFREDGAHVEFQHTFVSSDTYDFEMYATGVDAAAELRVSVDGVPVEWPESSGTQTLSIPKNTGATALRDNAYQWSLPISAGDHTFRVEKVSGGIAEVYHYVFHTRESDGIRGYLDLEDDPLVHYLIQAGIRGISNSFRIHDNYVPQGKSAIPIYMTEYNTSYSSHIVEDGLQIEGVDLRDAMIVWTTLLGMVNQGIEIAVIHQLFEDNIFGLVEGIGKDEMHNEYGRADPRRRPTFYALKMARDHLLPTRVEATVTSPEVTVTDSSGMRIGIAGIYNAQLPLVEVVASKSDDGRELHIAMINRDAEDPQMVSFNINGFGPISPRATLDLLSAPTLGSNNEPEPDICSHPTLGCPEMARTERYALDGVGTSFAYQLPRHSIAAITLKRSDVDWAPPAQVPTLVAGIFGGLIKLGWPGVSDGDIAGYNIYRSMTPGGPYGLRIAQVSATTRTFIDPDATTASDYYYAVEAFDGAGNLGARSPAAYYDAELALAAYGFDCTSAKSGGAKTPLLSVLAFLALLALPLGFARWDRSRRWLRGSSSNPVDGREPGGGGG
ncbi:MAG: hypothetical protein KC466_11515, partial [Myxococcales bacterium]|nr:hypothetical protein [Myxococcales bacterium]